LLDVEIKYCSKHMLTKRKIPAMAIIEMLCTARTDSDIQLREDSSSGPEKRKELKKSNSYM